MAMGTKQDRQQQEELFYAREQAEAPGHPFYQRLNQVLEQADFDKFCEDHCRQFYHSKLGRPSFLEQHWQTCHRPGEVAPMPLLSYADARPWANAIKTEAFSVYWGTQILNEMMAGEMDSRFRWI